MIRLPSGTLTSTINIMITQSDQTQIFKAQCRELGVEAEGLTISQSLYNLIKVVEKKK